MNTTSEIICSSPKDLQEDVVLPQEREHATDVGVNWLAARSKTCGDNSGKVLPLMFDICARNRCLNSDTRCGMP